jgi:hypothetical protein
MKRLALVLAILLASVALFGCGSYQPNHGYVTGRELDPAHQDSSTYCVYQGQYGCMAYTTDTWWVDTSYWLKLKTCVPKDDKEKCMSAWRQVDQADYDAYDYESFYPHSKLAQYAAKPGF